MTIIVYILTALFAAASFIIVKKKRFKAMPLICSIIFISFVGFGIISVLSVALPYGEILVYPLFAVVMGLMFILIGLNDLYSLVRCKEKVDGVYCGYNTYYGGKGISTQAPVFEYKYNGIFYREQTAQNISYKKLNRNMVQGSVYSIYIDPKRPAVYIFTKKIKATTIIAIVIGMFFLTFGADLLSDILPVFASLIK